MLPGITPSLLASAAASLTAEVLIVAGGGGGGGRANSGGTGTGAGGGGGGGVLQFPTAALTPKPYTITIGLGGAGATAGVAAANGANSSVTDFTTAIGGGRGGNYDASLAYSEALSGGSGGGARGLGSGAAGTAGQGNAGGTATGASAGAYPGGGGGGAGGAGGAGSGATPGAAGVGVSYSTSGTATLYGMGGCGNSFNGAVGTVAPGYQNPGSGGNAAGEGGAGVAGTPGIVIFQYSGATTATGGIVTKAGGKTQHIFTGAGTFTPTGPVTVTEDSFTKLLLHMDGSNGSTLFIDSSPAAHSNATVVAPAQITTAQSKFGGASAQFTPNSYLQFPNHADWNFGNGPFTVDYWERRTSSAVGSAPIVRDGPTLYTGWVIGYYLSGNLIFNASSNGSSWDIANGQPMGAAELNVWHHFAVVRNGDTIYLFRDGVLTASFGVTAGISFNNPANPMQIGCGWQGQFFSGQLDEVRICKGVARWTSAFTPPSAPYST